MVHLLASMFLAMASILCLITATAKIYAVARHPRFIRPARLLYDVLVTAALFACCAIWALESAGTLRSDPRTIVYIIPPLIVVVLAVLEDAIELLP